ncbi:MAG TPA: hypothetical protein GXX37_02000 [Clostridiaceae bacterium]|jgi:two-component SAPR family response regulator|nr:hypothetical protein [Clostridiaceae bacterium]
MNYYDWTENKRRLMDEALVNVIVQAAEYEAKMNLKQTALELLKLGLIRDSLHQALNVNLIKLYVQLNEKVAAIKHYE